MFVFNTFIVKNKQQKYIHFTLLRNFVHACMWRHDVTLLAEVNTIHFTWSENGTDVGTLCESRKGERFTGHRQYQKRGSGYLCRTRGVLCFQQTGQRGLPSLLYPVGDWATCCGRKHASCLFSCLMLGSYGKCFWPLDGKSVLWKKEWFDILFTHFLFKRVVDGENIKVTADSHAGRK